MLSEITSYKLNKKKRYDELSLRNGQWTDGKRKCLCLKTFFLYKLKLLLNITGMVLDSLREEVID